MSATIKKANKLALGPRMIGILETLESKNVRKKENDKIRKISTLRKEIFFEDAKLAYSTV